MKTEPRFWLECWPQDEGGSHVSSLYEDKDGRLKIGVAPVRRVPFDEAVSRMRDEYRKVEAPRPIRPSQSVTAGSAVAPDRLVDEFLARLLRAALGEDTDGT